MATSSIVETARRLYPLVEGHPEFSMMTTTYRRGYARCVVDCTGERGAHAYAASVEQWQSCGRPPPTLDELTATAEVGAMLDAFPELRDQV